MCKTPFRVGVEEFGCGQCMPCLTNRRRLWQGRIMLEREQHDASCFVTLTFRKEAYPADLSPGNLKRIFQRFLKRLRAAIEPARVRYYAVGELGGITGRAHYHMALFGLLPLDHKGLASRVPCGCVLCRSWSLGGVHVGLVEAESAGYLVGYITDKSKALFALMSRKPGIGAASADDIARFYAGSARGARILASGGDVGNVVRRGGKMWPLGRYLRNRMREAVGMELGEPLKAKDERLVLLQAELSTVEGRLAREDKRSSEVARAEKLAQISRSKKGVGL